jgi:predicted nuclease of predicted toxin-antitoxin system
LKERGSEAHYGPDLFSGDEDDAVIARYAAEHQLIVVSKDRDFVDLQSRYGNRVLWLRCGNILNARLYSWLDERWPELAAELDAGERLVIARSA